MSIATTTCNSIIRDRWLQTGLSEEVTAMNNLASYFNGVSARPGDGRRWIKALRGFRDRFGCPKVSDGTLTTLLDLLDKKEVFK